MSEPETKVPVSKSPFWQFSIKFYAVPGVAIEHIETPNPLNPLGVKGAGEGGTIPAPAAIIAAIEDALSPFGVHFTDIPLTPDRIVAALHAAGAYAKLSAA